MKELVVYIAKNLVDKPEAVEVQEEVKTYLNLFELNTYPR